MPLTWNRLSRATCHRSLNVPSCELDVTSVCNFFVVLHSGSRVNSTFWFQYHFIMVNNGF